MAGLPVHGLDQWLDEVMLFPDWYDPALGIEGDRDAFRAAWDAVLAPVAADGLPRVTVLRDYHAENIMLRSEEHTSELQSLMRNSYADFCFKTQHSAEQQLAQQSLMRNF